jgi:putative ABC transport system permease protein
MYAAHAQTALPPERADSMIVREARSMVLVVHAEPDARALAAPIRDVLRRLDPSVPVDRIRTLADVRTRAAANRKFPTVLLIVFAVVAMVLASVGVYAVVAASANRRIHEIGVRMAVGAEAAEIRRMMLWQGLGPVAVGTLLGVALSAVTTRLLKSLLFEVAPTDPTTLLTVPLLIVGAAATASFIPALRASRVDPAAVLRSE